MDEEEYGEISRGARRYFEEWMAEASYRSGTVELFEKAMGKEGAREEVVGLKKAAGAGS